MYCQILTHGNDPTSLHRHIPKDILPVEYGGTQSTFDNTKWREQIIADEEYFDQLESYSYDTKKITEFSTSELNRQEFIESEDGLIENHKKFIQNNQLTSDRL